ncbi:MAG: hypothetical protein AAF639_43835, partial [Chloroflexota bacterium]
MSQEISTQCCHGQGIIHATRQHTQRFRQNPRQTHWRRPLRLLAVTTVMLAILLGISATPAQADVIELKVYTLNDGVAPFDADDAVGNDSAIRNGIVRTRDELTYRAVVETDGGDTAVVITMDLPTIDTSANAGAAVATWKQVPPQCTGAGSALTNDGRTLLCDLGDLPNPSTQAIEPIAVVNGQTPNGQELDFAGPADGEGTASATSTETAGNVDATYYTTIDDGGGGLSDGTVLARLDEVVTAAPGFDIDLVNNPSGFGRTLGTILSNALAASGPNGEPGYRILYTFALSAQKLQGSEALGTDPLTFVFDIDSTTNPFLSGTLLYDWDGLLGCTTSSINQFYMPLDPGVASTDPLRVANGGTCVATQPGGAGTDIILTVTGIDTNLNHYPTTTLQGWEPPLIPRFYAMLKTVRLWVPLDEVTAISPDRESLTAQIDFQTPPTSITGQTNVDPDTTNQDYTVEVFRSEAGIANKRNDVAQTGLDYPEWVDGDPRVISAHIFSFAQPGQKYPYAINFSNTGTDSFTAVSCEKIDNARHQLLNATPGFNATYQGTPSGLGRLSISEGLAEPTVEWGVQLNDGAGNILATWPEYPNAEPIVNDATNFPDLNGSTLYETAMCPDADPSGNTAGAPTAYFNSLDAVLAAGFSLSEVTMLRVTGVIGAGQSTSAIPIFSLRDTFAYDVTDIDVSGAGPFSYTAGDPIPADTYVPNYAAFTRNGTRLTNTRQFLRVAPQQYLSRIVKTADPANNLQVAPGQTIHYTLAPRVAALGFATTPQDVTVVDILPPGVTYLTMNAGPSAPVVQTNTPAAGFTTLTWTYNNVLPPSGTQIALTPIEISVRVNTDLVSGDQLTNWTTISSPIDQLFDDDCVYDAGNDPALGYGDCAKASSTTHIISAPPGFQVFKEVLTRAIEPDQQIEYNVNWASIGNNTADLRVIDVFPWNGDGRTDDLGATSFNGTLTLASATPTGDLATATQQIYFTAASPGSINPDPQDASNTLTGGIWCIAAQFGSGGSCPATLADATAVLVDQSSMLMAGVTYSLQLVFDTSGNAEDDIYTNSHTVNDSGSALSLLTGNDVSAYVARPSISSVVWFDTNNNG